MSTAFALRLSQEPELDPRTECLHCGSPVSLAAEGACPACQLLAAGYEAKAGAHLRLVDCQPVAGDLSARLDWQAKRQRWHELGHRAWWACSICRRICTPSTCCEHGLPEERP